MSEPKDGGAAFPRAGIQNFPGSETGHAFAREGMSLRDYFAGQAMVGALAFRGSVNLGGERTQTVDEYARVSYQLADAMLAARLTP